MTQPVDADSYLDDDIPVVDKSGSRRLVRGSSIVNLDDDLDTTVPVAAPAVLKSAAEDKPAPSVAPPAPVAPSVPVTPPSAPPVTRNQTAKADLLIDTSAEQAEVQQVAGSKRFQAVLKGAEAMEVIRNSMADDAVSALHLDDAMRRRFRSLADLYFRDLRDGLETISKMTMPIASGGMGMNDEQAEDVMNFLRAKNGELLSVLKNQTAEEKDAYLSRLASERLRKAEIEAKSDRQELDELYERVTQPAERPTPPSAKPMGEPRMIPVISHDEPVQPVQDKSIEDMLSKTKSPDEAPASVVPVEPPDLSGLGQANKPRAEVTPGSGFVPPNLPIEEVPDAPDAPASAEAVKSAADSVAPPPASAAPVVSAAPAPIAPPAPPASAAPPAPPAPVAPSAPPPRPETPKQPSPPPAVKPIFVQPITPPAPTVASAPVVATDKPRFSDVMSSPKLVGPVEELSQLNLADFRRLSRDPKEACLKIADKIDILAEQSFEFKSRAIKAWQDSSVNRLYLDILRASLDGQPVGSVIEKRDAAGEPTLTKPEFESIMDLNRKLRFG